MTEHLWSSLLNDALDVLAHAIRVASETTAADALEYIADWLNAHDAVEDEDLAAWAAWEARGRP